MIRFNGKPENSDEGEFMITIYDTGDFILKEFYIHVRKRKGPKHNLSAELS